MSDAHDVWLADAVEAARECARDDSPATLEGAATRSRIHASLERRRGTSKRRLTLISAAIASMFGSTAFAYYSGWRPFSRAPEPAPAVATVDETPPALTPKHRGPRGEVVQPPAPESLAPEMPAPESAAAENGDRPHVPAPETPAPSPTLGQNGVGPHLPATPDNPARAPAPPRPRVSATREAATPARPDVGQNGVGPHVPATPDKPMPPTAAPDAELAAYQQAHDAHFRGTDPAAALAAWDRYLAQFPDGKLTPEARYDRALVLVKLARWREAREALAPFASAPVGSYRQAEAAKILDAIKSR